MNDVGNLEDAVMPPASVVIVDDDTALCELLQGRLDDEPGLMCAGIATTPERARTLVGTKHPLIIIVDIGLGAGVDAIDLVLNLVMLSPSSQVLIWTKWTDPSAGRTEEIRRKVRAHRNGASDWIAKGDGIEKLVDRIHAAVRRGPPNRVYEIRSPIEASLDDLIGPAPVRARPEVSDRSDGLTPAERRVAAAAAQGLEHGMTIEQIAKALKITIQTLRTHLRSIYTKWDVHAQAEFVAEARKRGLV